MYQFLHEALPDKIWENRLIKDGPLRFLEFGPLDVDRLQRLGIKADRLGPRLVSCMWNENSPLEIGGFLVENGLISNKQLKDSLLMQKDNTARLIGEILVTQGFLSKEELIMALEAFLMTTGTNDIHVDEWLDQEEIDMLMERLQSK